MVAWSPPTVRAIWEAARRVQSAGEDGASTLGWGTAIALSPSGERIAKLAPSGASDAWRGEIRSEEHTSELQSLMRNSYAVFCLKKKKKEMINSRDEKC